MQQMLTEVYQSRLIQIACEAHGQNLVQQTCSR